MTIIRCPVCQRILCEVQPGAVYIQIRGLRIWLDPTTIQRVYCPTCKTVYGQTEIVTAVRAPDETKAHHGKR